MLMPRRMHQPALPPYDNCLRWSEKQVVGTHRDQSPKYCTGNDGTGAHYPSCCCVFSAQEFVTELVSEYQSCRYPNGTGVTERLTLLIDRLTVSSN